MTTPNDELRSLIDAAAGAADRSKPASGRSAAARTTADAKGALHQALRSVKSRDTRTARSSMPNSGHGRSASPVNLSDAVRQAQVDGDASDSGPAKPLVFKNPRVIAITLALALLLLGLGVWKISQPVLSGHPDTLQQLAKSIEQYRHSRNGRLPEQLSNLEHFPKNAVEWQLTHWRARDAAGRTEIFWAPNGTRHYRIVLRHGTEVWVYNDQNGQSKQTKQ